MNITDVLIDVDETLTEPVPGSSGNGKDALTLLAELVAGEKGVSIKEALARIRNAGNPDTTCLFMFLPELGVEPQRLWERLLEQFRREIRIADDAAFLLRRLRARGKRVYSATTNSRMATLAKLAVGGLADMQGTPYFTGFFGGNAFGDPGGKFAPGFFASIMKAAKLNSEATMMIGDSPDRDRAPALAAGIRHVVLVNRAQSEPCIKGADCAFSVNSLALVDDMIE